jgi:hypothetical protein
MLADKYLHGHHFKIFHNIDVKKEPGNLYTKMLEAKPGHRLIRTLFWIRGIHVTVSIKDLPASGFVLLEEIKGVEIAYGIVSASPYFGACLEKFSPADFRDKFQDGYLRGLIVFGISGKGAEKKLFTETRVHCGSEKIYNRFRVYWFFIKPFSSLIRRIMLKQIRNNIMD